jgi:hypothetical protein
MVSDTWYRVMAKAALLLELPSNVGAEPGANPAYDTEQITRPA